MSELVRRFAEIAQLASLSRQHICVYGRCHQAGNHFLHYLRRLLLKSRPSRDAMATAGEMRDGLAGIRRGRRRGPLATSMIDDSTCSPVQR